uniref:RNA silencing suppressor n=1 Tax=Helleborus net necrosis virus TaxID=592206 RepID=B9UZ40_9VIRU|nr:putative nucleic acid binding protein [Helleborus net necrosis virus]
MRIRDQKRALCSVFAFYCGNNCSYADVVGVILSFVLSDSVGFGTSNYAKKRRARQVNRCWRCYRVIGGLCLPKNCNGVTCVPTSSNIASFILTGHRVLDTRSRRSRCH